MVMNYSLKIEPIDRTAGDRLNNHPSLECYLLQSEAEIIEYEKALYREFTRKNPHNWLCRNYLLIENNRYKSPIPYSSQSVYGIYRESNLISAAAINFDTHRQMQFEAVGFSRDRSSIDCNFCEVLTFFICQEKHLNFNYLKIIARLKEVILTDLKNKNISFGLANCTENLLPLYLRTGWTIASQKTLEGTTKYLIEYKITP